MGWLRSLFGSRPCSVQDPSKEFTLSRKQYPAAVLEDENVKYTLKPLKSIRLVMDADKARFSIAGERGEFRTAALALQQAKLRVLGWPGRRVR